MTIGDLSRKKVTNSENKIKNYLYIERGAELKSLRGSQSVKDFAKALGVAPKTYYRYESGERKVPDGLLKLARILSKNKIVEGDHYMIKDRLNESVAEHVDNFHAPLSINNEEYELIKALRELDPLGRKGVYISAVGQCNEAMRERTIRKDKRKKEILEKTIKTLTKAIGEI